MPAAVAIPAIIGAGTSLAGGALQSRAAKGAAKTQAASADKAMQLQGQLFRDALLAQQQQNAITNQLYAPYTNSAPMSLAALNNMVLGGGEGYYAPGSFNLPQRPVGNPALQPMQRPGLPGMAPPGTPPPGMPPGGMPPRGMPPRPGIAVPRSPGMRPMSTLYG